MSTTRRPRPASVVATICCTVLTALIFAVAGARAARAVASPPTVTYVTCSSAFPGISATCGTVEVPLDRAHPVAGTIPIYFELYRGTGGHLRRLAHRDRPVGR